MTQWPLDALKPYHRQEEMFPEDKINPAKLQALHDSIATNGLDRPLRITPDGTIMDGFHRWQIAQALGWERIAVEVLPYPPDSDEAQRIFLESNIGSVHDDPMVQARLLQERVRLAGIQRGGDHKSGKSNGQNDLLKNIAAREGMSESTLKRTLNLNKLILPFQDLIRAGTLGTSHGAALATMTVDQQQALYDAIGDSVTTLKVADIQAAKKIPDTSALEAQMAALTAERGELQRQLAAQTVTPSPDDETASSSLVESLKIQLDAAEATRQEYADEVARLKAQTPVERIVEKVVTVEKPDPAQAERIAKLESDLAAAQQKVESLLQTGYKQADLNMLESRRKEAEKQLAAAQAAFARVTTRENDQTTYRALVGKFVQEALKRFHQTAGEWQRIAEYPRFPLNISLYHDVQALAGQLESVAAGLRLMELDPAALKKRQQRAALIIDTTAIVIHEPETDTQGGMRDVFADDNDSDESDTD